MKILYKAQTTWWILQDECELSGPLWAHLGTQSPFITRLLRKNVLSIPNTDVKMNFLKKLCFSFKLSPQQELFFCFRFCSQGFSYFLVGIYFFHSKVEELPKHWDNSLGNIAEEGWGQRHVLLDPLGKAFDAMLLNRTSNPAPFYVNTAPQFRWPWW